MALTAKKVYAILKRQISDMEAKLNSPVRYRGTVATADLLPLNPDIGDMYNIESKSIYGEAGMNVAWNGVVWDTMGAPIDMSLYFTKEEAEAVIQRLVTEYFEKNPVKPGATAEQALQIEQNKTNIASLKTETGSLKEDLGDLSESKISKFHASNQGETHLADSDNGKIMDMMLYGISSQDGTPTPENPVEIKSVVNPTVKVTNKDGLKVQSVTLNNITLNAIPVSSGGNVTINGQQYTADYVDVERGKLVRMVTRLNLKDVDTMKMGIGFHSNGIGYLSISIEESSKDKPSKDKKPISNKYIGGTWNNKSGYVYIPSNRSVIFVDKRFTDRETAIKLVQDTYVIYALSLPTEEDLPLEQIKLLKSLSVNYPTTNISVNSEQLDGYTVFNYPISMTNGWNYVKKQLNDNRDYIYDMDIQSAEAYVNSEYAVTLTELEA